MASTNTIYHNNDTSNNISQKLQPNNTNNKRHTRTTLRMVLPNGSLSLRSTKHHSNISSNGKNTPRQPRFKTRILHILLDSNAILSRNGNRTSILRSSRTTIPLRNNGTRSSNILTTSNARRTKILLFPLRNIRMGSIRDGSTSNSILQIQKK